MTGSIEPSGRAANSAPVYGAQDVAGAAVVEHDALGPQRVKHFSCRRDPNERLAEVGGDVAAERGDSEAGRAECV